MNLSLTIQESEALVLVLESYISDLRMEIADTDRRRMRDQLKERERELRAIQLKLQAVAAPTGGWPYEPAPDVDEQEITVPAD